MLKTISCQGMDISEGFLPMSPAAVLLHTPWTFTVMAKLKGPWFSTPPQHQEFSEGQEVQHPAALRHPHASPRWKLGQSGLPRGLERDWNHDSQQRGTPNLGPNSISLMLYKLVGVVCIPQAHAGRGLSCQLLQNPMTQDLQPAVLITGFLRDQKPLR